MFSSNFVNFDLIWETHIFRRIFGRFPCFIILDFDFAWTSKWLGLLSHFIPEITLAIKGDLQLSIPEAHECQIFSEYKLNTYLEIQRLNSKSVSNQSHLLNYWGCSNIREDLYNGFSWIPHFSTLKYFNILVQFYRKRCLGGRLGARREAAASPRPF